MAKRILIHPYYRLYGQVDVSKSDHAFVLLCTVRFTNITYTDNLINMCIRTLDT